MSNNNNSLIGWIIPTKRGNPVLLNFGGEINTLTYFARRYGHEPHKVYQRLRLSGYTVFDALNMPSYIKYTKKDPEVPIGTPGPTGPRSTSQMKLGQSHKKKL